MIRAVVFDIGGVVCAFDPDRRLQELATRAGLDREHIHDAIWASGIDARAEGGAFSTADTERLLLEALGPRIDAVGLREAWSSAFVIDPRVRDIIASVDRPVFGFTNNGPMFTVCLAHELAPIARVFERVICSWQVRARKPQPGAFERLCRELRREPEDLCFVDDSGDDVEAARVVGLTAIEFSGAERLADDLGRYQLVR